MIALPVVLITKAASTQLAVWICQCLRPAVHLCTWKVEHHTCINIHYQLPSITESHANTFSSTGGWSRQPSLSPAAAQLHVTPFVRSQNGLISRWVIIDELIIVWWRGITAHLPLFHLRPTTGNSHSSCFSSLSLLTIYFVCKSVLHPKEEVQPLSCSHSEQKRCSAIVFGKLPTRNTV